MSKEPAQITVLNIFNDKYIIPIYQRSYAWGSAQIEQLIADIESTITNNGDSHYFIGNLTINDNDNGLFEVIDGQQRLTTLYLLQKYLDLTFDPNALSFEAREKSNRTLIHNGLDNVDALKEHLSASIIDGYNIISNYFKSQHIDKEEFKDKLKRVFLVRVQVPEKIDLNHYFEIMNTRGEQLELHQIAKARLLEKLKCKQDKHVANEIWEKCSDMHSYVQMNFIPEVRKVIFSDDWTKLSPDMHDFDSLVNVIAPNGHSVNDEQTKRPTLKSILESNNLRDESTSKQNNEEEQDENQRFESIISFPNFLLQVNAVITQENENEARLSDLALIDNLESHWQKEEKAKTFLFALLKCRVLFDQYILKRKFTNNSKYADKDHRRWSLERLVKSDSRSPKYIKTVKKEDDINNNQLLVLQSCLRITYTSPKTMHWITLVLKALFEDENRDIICILEDYCRKKVRDSNSNSNSNSNSKYKSGIDFERIVFSYLDYLLYRDGYDYENKPFFDKFENTFYFQFRNSIEHFYPQNPTEFETWKDNTSLNHFGNLALITVSGNSKFSNLKPKSKVDTFEHVVKQSLKLKIMAKLIENAGEWTPEKAKKHGEEMLKILEQDISKIPAQA